MDSDNGMQLAALLPTHLACLTVCPSATAQALLQPLARLRALKLGFDSIDLESAWLAPLLTRGLDVAAATQLTSLELGWRPYHAV